jgi:hypothetical protein
MGILAVRYKLALESALIIVSQASVDLWAKTITAIPDVFKVREIS